MRLFYLCVAVFISTFILLLIGGIVNPMGASLACPDWYFVPTCNGELFPEMKGGVFYEHGHRLWASGVGLLTLIMATWTIFTKKIDSKTKWIAALALFLVCLQGTLGGVTVLLGLSKTLSTLHLCVAMIFLVVLVELCFRYHAYGTNGHLLNLQPMKRKMVLWTLVFVSLQIYIGGMVRHMGAGLACGDDWVGCGPNFWPTHGLGHMHMFHRFYGYFLALMVVGSCMQAYKQLKHRSGIQIFCSFLPIWLVITQIALGLATVATIRSIPIVVMHTGVAALLVVSLFLQYKLLRKPSQL